jgi:glutamyl-tRNA reductase
MLKENVKNEANKVIKDLFENKHEEVVALLYKKAEEIRRKEVAEALSLLSRYVDKETLDNIAVILEGLTSSIIRKLYHPYSEAIRMIGNGNDSKEFIKLILTLNGESVDGD